MKQYLATLIFLVAPVGIISSTPAQTGSILSNQDLQLRAGFGVSFPGGRVEIEDRETPPAQEEKTNSTGQDSSTATSDGGAEGFSGEYAEYLDDYNGFKVQIPEEFKLNNKGQSTNWIGPMFNGSATGIYVNAAPLPSVDPQMLQQTYKKQYEQDRNYTEVVLTQVRYGNKMVPALRVREINNRPGTRDLKSPDDIHRWHLFVFGNERVYTWGFTGIFQDFQENRVQGVYEYIIESVELVPII